jgi:AmmeMemoRadiSam system protein A
MNKTTKINPTKIDKKKKKMLDLARLAIISIEHPQKIEELKQKKSIDGMSGVFVTVNVEGDLRGCIGNLDAINLQEGIIQNAIYAAYYDSRFPPIQKEEWPSMKISINLLSKPKPLAYKNTDDLLKKIHMKGVIIEKDFSKATFLPVVWKDLPKAQEFMEHLCMKAGLDSDEWKKLGLKVWVYESDEFEEE